MINSIPLVTTNSHKNPNFDSLLIISTDLNDVKKRSLDELYTSLSVYKQGNINFDKDLTFLIDKSQRIIYSPTGPLIPEYDDVRRVAEAAQSAIKKAILIGSKKPLLINCTKDYFKSSDEVALLSALQNIYVPLEIRELPNRTNSFKIDELGYYYEDEEAAKRTLTIINAIEIGRIVYRDIGGSDPERMASIKILEYVQETFKMSPIKIESVDSQEDFEKFYPCFAAVNRAANVVPRHKGRIIKLEYSPPDSEVDTTLFLVGKGITYDTGGADVKTGGCMAGMHRDKCGAAFVAGFFKVLALLKPKGLKVYGTLCCARNSIGEESYVSDELITSRANIRIRIGNTDAEGRMVMTDPLCEAKEIALKSINPQLFTIATLTGHVIRCYGENYSAILCNASARKLSIDKVLQEIGESIGDPYEISTIRSEDFKFVSGKSECEDLLQCNSKPSSETPRGHQFPAAFMIRASGLDKHFINSNFPLPYAHCDIAGSSGPPTSNPTAAPLPSFIYKYIVPRV